MQRFPRYGRSARVYDAVSFERLVYRAGRVAGVDALALRPGDRVADVGCGTGLTLPLLREAVGATGRVVGIDASPSMLAQAARRVREARWDNVQLHHADVTDPDALATALRFSDDGGTRPDRVIFVYALSLMGAWPAVWASAVSLAGPGARLAVVDMADPINAASVWRPLARLACWAGGADIDAHPWTAAERDLVEVITMSRRGGHIQVRAGTVAPAQPGLGPPR